MTTIVRKRASNITINEQPSFDKVEASINARKSKAKSYTSSISITTIFKLCGWMIINQARAKKT